MIDDRNLLHGVLLQSSIQRPYVDEIDGSPKLSDLALRTMNTINSLAILDVAPPGEDAVFVYDNTVLEAFDVFADACEEESRHDWALAVRLWIMWNRGIPGRQELLDARKLDSSESNYRRLKALVKEGAGIFPSLRDGVIPK